MISYFRLAANNVAESTLFSSTLQYLVCLININRTARSVIEIIRRNGVVPATIAVLNGKLHIGLTRSELEYISKMGKSAIKTSRRDLSAVLSKVCVPWCITLWEKPLPRR